MCREEFEFLATAAEDERVAALEPHDVATGPGVLEHQLVDAALAHRMAAGHLADRDPVRVATREREYFFRDEPVVQDHVGLLQSP